MELVVGVDCDSARSADSFFNIRGVVAERFVDVDLEIRIGWSGRWKKIWGFWID